METAAPATMILAIGTALCSPPSPASGAMVPAAHPLDVAEKSGAGAGMGGDGGGGERAAVGSDQALGAHQEEEADEGDDQWGVEPTAPMSMAVPAAGAAIWPTRMTVQVRAHGEPGRTRKRGSCRRR